MATPVFGSFPPPAPPSFGELLDVAIEFAFEYGRKQGYRELLIEGLEFRDFLSIVFDELGLDFPYPTDEQKLNGEYKHIYAYWGDNELLYVGQSKNSFFRHIRHCSDKKEWSCLYNKHERWWVPVQYIDMIEKVIIKVRKPRFNILFNGDCSQIDFKFDGDF